MICQKVDTDLGRRKVELWEHGTVLLYALAYFLAQSGKRISFSLFAIAKVIIVFVFVLVRDDYALCIEVLPKAVLDVMQHGTPNGVLCKVGIPCRELESVDVGRVDGRKKGRRHVFISHSIHVLLLLIPQFLFCRKSSLG
jgi:hypothetical protein